MKRLLDIVCVLIGIPLFGPVALLLTILIKCDDGGPVFFLQDRLGRGKRTFRIYKFRTMKDGQVTRVGRIVRATGLDEIAQFINVARGDIAIVGPRPLTLADIERLGWNGPAHAWRWTVPPGLTGLAQIHGGRSARHSRRLDRLYAKRAGFVVDCRIILVSFAMNCVGKHRVRRWMR